MIRKNSNCPICNNSGYIFTEDNEGRSYVKQCSCVLINDAINRINKSGLAKEFQEKSFDTFQTYGIQQLEDAKTTTEKYTNTLIAGKEEKGNSLLLCGQVGAGKTHLGTACCMRLIENNIAVIYMGYREVITSLKAKITYEQEYAKEINRYKRAQVLFIDDFLKGRITESDLNIIYEIVNYRYNNHLPVIISTEKNLSGLINFDEAIGSRLIEMCRGNIIVFEGKELNYRLYRGTEMHV